MLRKIVIAGLVAPMLLALGCWSNNLESGRVDLLSFMDLDINILPRVVSVSPANNARGIATDVQVQARFNREMDPVSISAATITLADSNYNPVSGTVAYDAAARTATFTPSAALDMLTSYTATVSAAVTDLEGQTLEADFMWRFTTVAAGTVPAPAIDPLPGSYPAPLSVTISCTETAAEIWYTTDGVTDPASGVGTLITGGSGTVTINSSTTFRAIATLSGWNDSSITERIYAVVPTYTVDYDGNGNTGGTAPADPVAYRTGETAVVLGQGDLSRDAHTFAGWNTMADGTGTPYAPGASLTLGASDVVLYAQWNLLPAITSVSPANGATGIDVATEIQVYFNKEMEPASVSAATVTLSDEFGNPVSGSVSYDVMARAALFTPGAALVGLASYTAAVTTGVADLEGNSLAADYTWVFSTAALGTVSTPILNPGGGTYPPGQLILVTCATPSAEIWYTTDGVTDPALGVGTQISSGDHIGLSLPSTTTIRAIAILDGWNSSSIVQQTYIILPEYAVTYNPNGAAGSTMTTFYLEGSNVTVSPNSYTRTGYIFMGWNTQPGGTGVDYQPGNTFAINNNIVLYAQWASDGLAYTTYGGGYSVNAGTVTSGNVVIPATYAGLPVVAIEDSGFYGLTGLTGVTIGPNVSTIGIDAFRGCSGITSIAIPDSVTDIGTRAFWDCTSATGLTIGSGVATIGQYAFYNCGAITAVNLPNGVTTIGDYAFCNCSSLSNVTIPNSVTSLGLGAFMYCASLTAVTIPDSVTVINNYTFSGSGLINIVVPATVTSIGYEAFASCADLVEVSLGINVASIGNYAFRSCANLATVYAMPATPPVTQANIFNGDTSLADIIVSAPGYVSLYQAAAGWSDYAGIIRY